MTTTSTPQRRLSERVNDATLQNEYQRHFVNEMYNNASNYYEDVQDDYELSPDRLKILKDVLLGTGHFSKVYLGVVRCNLTDRQVPVAVKMVKAENAPQSADADATTTNVNVESRIAKQIDALRIELNTLAYIQRLNERQHPNLIRLIGASTTRDDEFYLMTEYCEYGSLDRYLQEKYKNKQFINEIVCNGERDDGYKVVWKRANSRNWESMSRYFRRYDHITTSDLLSFAEQVASAMEYLSSKNILHRDVALRNVFLKTNMTIKLGDFGLSRQLVDGSTTYLQSKMAEIPVRYTALESLLFTIYTIESECWTFGVVLWELFTFAQSLPYEKELPTFSIAQLKSFLISGNRLSLPTTAPYPVQKLMLSTWSENSHERPTFGNCKSTIAAALNDALGRRTTSTEDDSTVVVAICPDTFAADKKSNLAIGKKSKIALLLICTSTTIIVSLIAIALWSLTLFRNGGANIPVMQQKNLNESSAIATVGGPELKENSEHFIGHLTYYDDVGYGACGQWTIPSTQVTAAVSFLWFSNSNPNEDIICHHRTQRCVRVTYKGRSIVAPVTDSCSDCDPMRLNLSQAAFEKLAALDIGHIYGAQWSFVKC